VILIIWTFVEDRSVHDVVTSHSVDSRYCSGGADCFRTEKQCVQHRGIIGYFAFFYIVLILIVGCVLSYQARGLPNSYFEAKYMMFAMNNIALTSTLVGIVWLVGNNDLDISVKTLLITVAVFITSTGSILLIFGPKFYQLMTQSEQSIRNRLRSTLRPSEQARRPRVYAHTMAIGERPEQSSTSANGFDKAVYLSTQPSTTSSNGEPPLSVFYSPEETYPISSSSQQVIGEERVRRDIMDTKFSTGVADTPIAGCHIRNAEPHPDVENEQQVTGDEEVQHETIDTADTPVLACHLHNDEQQQQQQHDVECDHQSDGTATGADPPPLPETNAIRDDELFAPRRSALAAFATWISRGSGVDFETGEMNN
jgi:7 transmembrane sweet-taste receptor of 3 GCPR